MKEQLFHKVLERGDTRIHYYMSDNDSLETIVFLHPAFGDHGCFDRQIDYFSAKFRVITLDMLGHGLSVVAKSKDKISSTAHHLDQILTQEKIEKVHLVGVSLGSLLAQDFALKYPQKVLSLTALGGYNINKEQKDVAKLQSKEVLKWLVKMLFSMDSFRRYAAQTSAMSTEGQSVFYESAKHFTRKSFQGMSGLGKLVKNRSVSRKFRLLILVGESDVELSKKMAHQWCEEEPGSEMCIIEKAGHCANLDNPLLFNEIVMKFIH